MKMRQFFMWVTVIFMAALFLGVSVSGAAESASQYRSVYSSGYKTVHNPGDGTTPLTKLSLQQTNSPGSYLFRFYIPPAVQIPPAEQKRVSLALFCPQNQMIGVVARLGFPPQCDIPAYSTSTNASESYFYGLPWLSAANFSGGSLQKFRDNDVRVRNHSGTIPLIKDYSPSSDGEWLYVKVLYDGEKAPNLRGFNFEVSIDGNAYKTWYANAEWDSSDDPLPNGKTPTGTVCNFESTGEGGVPTDDGGGSSDNPFAPVWPGSGPTPPTPDPIPDTPPVEETAYVASSEFPLYNVIRQEGEIVIFTPTLTFDNPPAEPVSCYAAYCQYNKIYVAQLRLDGEITFERYLEGDITPSYGTFYFSGGKRWECTAFEKLGLVADLISSPDVAIYVGVAAQGDLDLATLQGSAFTFKLDQ